MPSPPPAITAALLIAHGSRRDEANQDLADLADRLRASRLYPVVEIAYLELSPPSIAEGGQTCIERGATRVMLLPYFLSAGKHVVDDLEAARSSLAARFPEAAFLLCKPLSPHRLLLEVVIDRLAAAEFGGDGQSVPVETK